MYIMFCLSFPHFIIYLLLCCLALQITLPGNQLCMFIFYVLTNLVTLSLELAFPLYENPP